jgi:hypothetical protein
VASGQLAGRATVRTVMATRSETNDLMAEVRRYLVAVETFRAEGSEPVWLSEGRADDARTTIVLPTKARG